MKIFLLSFLFMGPVLAFNPDLAFQSGAGAINYGAQDLFSRRGELTPPPEIYDLKELNRVLFSETKNNLNELKKVKYYLLNGEIRMAKVYLSKLAYSQTKLRPIILRYLGVLAFVESDFEGSYSYLAKPELQSIPHFSKICTLKVLNQIVLNRLVDLENDWGRCQIENPNGFREKNLIWLDTLVQLKLYPRQGITKIPFKFIKLAALDNDELKMLMKLSLYLNQEQLILNQIPDLTLDQLQDMEVRELAGQVLFRSGSFAQAYRFVEDLKSPNAENIKGNLYVLRNKFELAYAQFKLALEQKQNSQNALERLLPLAWLLEDWENGSKYSEQIIASSETHVNKLTLMAAFYMQKGDYKKAKEILDTIAHSSRRGGEIEVTQLSSFTALMQNQTDTIKRDASLSCNQYDLIQCWVLYQLAQWDSFPITIRREEEVAIKKEWETLISEETSRPLQETVFVNQIDIEEMDDKLIQLIPRNSP